MHKYPEFSFFHTLTYPLGISSLLIILVTSMFITAALQGLIMMMLVVTGLGLFFLWYLKYAFLMLSTTAEGIPEVPVLSDTLVRPFEDMRHLKLLGLIFIHLMVMTTLADVSEVLSLFYLAGFLLLLPAMITTLAIDNRLLQTFNVVSLTNIVIKSGNLYGISYIFYLGSVFLINLLSDNNTGLFTMVFVTLYLGMVSFHLIGVTLYTRRHELGFTPIHSPEQVQQETEDAKHKQYRRIADALYHQYRQPTALSMLDRQLANEPIEAYDWFYNEISMWDKPVFLQRYLQHYLDKYANTTLLLKGMAHYESYLAKHPDYPITDENIRHTLISKLNELHAQHPANQDIARFLLLLNG